MGIFEILFGIGVLGFLVQLVLGFGHGGGHSVRHGGHHAVGHGSGHHGLKVGHGHGASHGHGTGNHGHAVGEDGASAPAHVGPIHHGGDWWKSIAMIFISPIDIFSLCMGAGLGGFIGQRMGLGAGTWIFAIFVALVIDFLVVRPMMGTILGFAATPSEGLEGSIGRTAVAVGNFDETGKGVIKLELDGEIVQLLAFIEPEEMSLSRVRKGDEVAITSVNAKKSRCTVSRSVFREFGNDDATHLTT